MGSAQMKQTSLSLSSVPVLCSTATDSVFGSVVEELSLDVDCGEILVGELRSVVAFLGPTFELGPFEPVKEVSKAFLLDMIGIIARYRRQVNQKTMSKSAYIPSIHR